MNANHLINNALVDITYDNEAATVDQRASIDDFIKNDLMGVVNEVFNEISDKGIVYRINNLELDLGYISYADYKEEMPKRLREQLITNLSSIRYAHQSGQAANGEVISRQSSEHAALRFFLCNGHLPWYCYFSNTNTLESVLKQTIHSNAEEFCTFLNSTPHKRIVTERLIKQFSAETITYLLQTLRASHSQTQHQTAAQIKEGMQHYTQSTIFDSHAISKANIVQQLHENIEQLESNYVCYQQLINKLNQIASDTSYSESKILADLEMLSQKTPWLLVSLYQQLQANQEIWHQVVNNLSIPILRQFIHELFSVAHDIDPAASSDFKTALQSYANKCTNQKYLYVHVLNCLINDKFIDFDALEISDSLSADPSVKEAYEERKLDTQTDLHSQLVAALLSGDMSIIKAHWPILYSDHPQLVKNTLRHYGQQPKVRKHIATSLPKEIVSDILLLIEPSEHDFILQVTEQAALFATEQGIQSTDHTQYKTDLCEFSLAYLLVERGSHFNKKAYLGSLIKQMAVSRNLNHSVLIWSMIKNINARAKKSKLAHELLQFLTDQQSKLEPNTIACQESHEANVLYNRLSSALSSSKINSSILLSDLELLGQKSPELLLKFYRQFQTIIPLSQQTIAGLSIPLLQQLAQAAITALSTGNPALKSKLTETIKVGAAQSLNKKTFFIQILSHFVRGVSIAFIDLKKEDLDTISTDIASRPQTKNNSIQNITNLLNSSYSLSEKTRAALIDSIELQAKREPIKLSQLFKTGLRNHSFINRIVELLPEWINVKLLRLLEITSANQMLLYSELINMVCHTTQESGQQKQLQQLKWHFIFSYIATTDNSSFNERHFVHQYIKLLNKKINNSVTLQQFHTLLTELLVQNRSPSTQKITQKIIHLISDATPKPTSLIEMDNSQNNETTNSENIYLTNAGIVLAAAYLPRLFAALGLLEKSAFKNRDAAEHGVHMLQFLVNESLLNSECHLVLNKILCGIQPGLPIRRGIELSKYEKNELEGLLLGMIQHWKSLGSTSITGLRESFLQRHGRLQLKDDAWYLTVEPKAFDMLLDQIPWSYSTIKFPWMQRVLYVEWR